MQPLGTKVYLLKRYSPSDSFCTFFLRVHEHKNITLSGLNDIFEEALASTLSAPVTTGNH